MKNRMLPLSITCAALVLSLAPGCKPKDVTFSPVPDDAAAVDGAGSDSDAPLGLSGFSIVLPSSTVAEGTTLTFTVALTSPPAGPMMQVDVVSAAPDSLGVSPVALRFTGADWSTPQTVTLTGRADDDVIDEHVALSLAGAAVATPYSVEITVADDDSVALQLSSPTLDVMEGDTAQLGISLSAQPASNVVVTVSTNNPAAATASQSTLTFTPTNWMSPIPLTIQGQQDDNAVTDTATITFMSSSAPAANLPVQILDDDTLGLVLSDSTVAISEGGSRTVTVALNYQPASDVTVTTASGAPAVAGASPASLTFAPAGPNSWDIPREVSLIAREDDDVVDGTSMITFTAPSLTERRVVASVTDDDIQHIRSTPTNQLTLTEGTNGTIDVALAFRPGQPITVTAASLLPGATVSPASLTFDSTSYAVVQRVTVAAVEDPDVAAGTSMIQFQSVEADLLHDVDVTIVDDDSLAIETDLGAGPTALTVAEGSAATFGVRLSAQPTSTTTVTIASSRTDAATATLSLSFTPSTWASYQMVTVTGVADDDLTDESATLTLSGAGTPVAIAVTVTDDDTQRIVATPAMVTVTEGSSATLNVVLAFQPVSDVTVSVVSGTPTAATVSSATLAFTAATYNQPQTVTIAGIDDADAVMSTSTLTLAAMGVAPTAVPVSVTDDDALNLDVALASATIGEAGTTTLAIKLTAAPSATTTVTIASSDAGAATVTPATLTFTAANHSEPQIVTVSGVNDADAADETVTVTASSTMPTTLAPVSAAITVEDDDTLAIYRSGPGVLLPEGGTAVFQVKLTAQPISPVTVTVVSADTGAASVSPPTLSFNAGNWNTLQPVTVSGVQDVDLASESVSIDLIAGGLGSSSVMPAAVIATVNDDDSQAILVDPSPAVVAEGAAGELRVWLAYRPASDVTITATASTGALVFTGAVRTYGAGTYSTEQAFEFVAGSDDDVVNTPVTVTLTCSDGTTVQVPVTVVDDDTVELVVTPPASPVIEAADGDMNVALTHQPTQAVTVEVTSADPGALTVSPSALMFTPANWNVAQQVVLHGEADADASNEFVTVAVTSTGMTTVAPVISVIDTDVQAILVSTSSVSLAETVGVYYFTVRLAARPSGTATVNVSTGALTSVLTLPGPTVLTFTDADYDQPRSVGINVVQDANFDYENAVVSIDSTGLVTKQLSIKIIEPEILSTTGMVPTSFCDGAQVLMPVKLKGDPKGSLSVGVTVSKPTLVTQSPYTLTFTSATYATNQNIVVTALSGAGNATVTLTSSGLTSRSDVIGVNTGTNCPGVITQPL